MTREDDYSMVEGGLLSVIYQLLSELKNYKALSAITLEANLNSDLGIGSIERLELLCRLEKRFAVPLSQEDMFSATMVKDLLAPLMKARLLLRNNHSADSYTLIPSPALEELRQATHSSPAVNKDKVLGNSKLWRGVRKIFFYLARLLYGLYFYLLAVVSIFLLWLLAWLVPKHSKIFPHLAPYWSRIFLFLTGCRLQVIGGENMITNGAVLLIANHASYIDTVILSASIPRDILFVAKAELLKSWVLMPFFKKQKHIAVDRNNLASAMNAITAIEQALYLGRAVMIYPEATFVNTPGLRLFKLGAFKAAVETNTPLCPIAINGARKLMGAYGWVWPVKIIISILPPIYPQGNDLAEIVRLRDISREMIAKESGDPILDLAAGGFFNEDDR